MLAEVPPETYVAPHQSVSLKLKKGDFVTGGWFAVYSLPHMRSKTPGDKFSEHADNSVVEAYLVKVISFSTPENGRTLELQIGTDPTGALTVGAK